MTPIESTAPIVHSPKVEIWLVLETSIEPMTSHIDGPRDVFFIFVVMIRGNDDGLDEIDAEEAEKVDERSD